MSISRASLEEEVYLRGLTGFLVGEKLYEGFKRIAFVTFADRICCSIVAAQIAGYMHRYGYGSGSFKVFFYEEGREDELARQVESFKPDAVSLMMGGEQKMSRVASATREVLKAFSRRGLRVPVIFHVRVFLATKQLSSLLADEEVSSYLGSLPELRVFTADLGAKKFFFNRISLEGGKLALRKFAESDLTEEHVDLLKRSLPPPE
ncbi:hypothetical protein [Thermofilum pendens]|uniref:Uncharacterized protein n=1 Tax=Thermofilum pendens (strain DSM 2475 / Hrk 5) TaxID=368408 RepID=A1RYS7_THEPD|nr:hypothetical protein [Thermofilum pendens]ABL78357.1 conserved hypothetical protein [Thermofilum pendens Hrk 5]